MGNGLLADPEWVALPRVTIWASLRISMNPRIFPRPLTVVEAFSIIREWMGLPSVKILTPGGAAHGDPREADY